MVCSVSTYSALYAVADTFEWAYLLLYARLETSLTLSSDEEADAKSLLLLLYKNTSRSTQNKPAHLYTITKGFNISHGQIFAETA